MDKIEIGDLVRNIRDKKYGIVVRIFKSGSIAVLEHIAPMVTTTHESSKTLEIVEKHSVDIFSEQDTNFSKAVRIIKKEFNKSKEPGEMYFVYQSNLACTITDNSNLSLEESNKIAIKFLDMFCKE